MLHFTFLLNSRLRGLAIVASLAVLLFLVSCTKASNTSPPTSQPAHADDHSDHTGHNHK